MIKPDFIVIGAMKCATSSVIGYLEGHPGAYLKPRCEPDFFNRDDNWAKGADWYDRFFAEAPAGRLVGEGSNLYANRARFPETAARMHGYCPDAKLIFMVRDPIARIQSHWIQRRADAPSETPPTPDQAVVEDPDTYLDQSRYWHQLAPYRERWGDDRILVGLLEDLNADPPAFQDRLCAFLGLAPYRPEAAVHANPSAAKRLQGPLFDRLRAIPGVRSLARIAPAGAKDAVRRLTMGGTAREAPRLTPETRARLTETLCDDSAALLDWLGKPRDTWPVTAG